MNNEVKLLSGSADQVLDRMTQLNIICKLHEAYKVTEFFKQAWAFNHVKLIEENKITDHKDYDASMMLTFFDMAKELDENEAIDFFTVLKSIENLRVTRN